MTIHEMMHAFVSDWLGDSTARLMGRVTLNPLKHMDPILTSALPLLMILSGSRTLFGAAKPVPVDYSRLKYGEFGGALVGMVGPLTNLAIAVVAGLLFKATNPAYGSLVYAIYEVTILLNVGMFIFNSIPWPPLDGSRLLYAFAPRPIQSFMETIESMGLTSIIVLVFIMMYVGSPVATLSDKLIGILAPGLII